MVRARILRACRENPSFFAVGCIIRQLSVASSGRWTMGRSRRSTIDRAPAKEPTITLDAKAWLVSRACDKAKDHSYPHELGRRDC